MHLSQSHLSLLGLSIGAGSLIFSHVNDAGFCLVKEYFGLTVGQTMKTWSMMETVLSFMGLAVTMLLGLQGHGVAYLDRLQIRAGSPANPPGTYPYGLN